MPSSDAKQESVYFEKQWIKTFGDFMSKLKRFVYSITLLLGLVINMSQVVATPIFISDYAHVVSFNTKTMLSKVLLNFQNTYNLHMDIVVFANFESKNPDGIMKYFYQQLEGRNPQVGGKGLILISLDDLYVNVKFSENAETIIDKPLQSEIIKAATTALKSENFDLMVTKPVQIIYKAFNPEGEVPTPADKSTHYGMYFMIWLILSAAGGVAAWFFLTQKKKK